MRLRRIHIYNLGLVPLMLVYYPWKRVAPNGIVFLAVIGVYLLLVRLLADRYGRP